MQGHGVRHYPDFVRDQFTGTEHGAESSTDGKAWPRPTFVSLQPGDAVLILGHTPHAASRCVETMPHARLQCYFRVTSTWRTIGGGAGEEDAVIQALCDPWLDWPPVAEYAQRQAAAAAAAAAGAVSFDHVHLISRDPKSAAAWYVIHLGGEITSVQEDLRGAVQVGVAFSQGMQLLLRGARPGERPAPTQALRPFGNHPDGVFVSHEEWGIDHFSFRVHEDIDDVCGRLRSAGVRFGTEEAGVPGAYAFKPSSRIAYVTGPDDVSIELVQGALRVSVPPGRGDGDELITAGETAKL